MLPIILGTGAVARYPLGRKFNFSTRKIEFADFSRQTFAQLATPLGSWVVNLALLQDAEANDWRDFHEAMLGGANSFAFIDPSDNLLQYSEQQESSPWVLTQCSAAQNTQISDPFGLISSRPRTLSIGSINGSLIQSVPIPPSGTGNSRTSGITVTASIYANAGGGYYGSGLGTGSYGTMPYGEGGAAPVSAFVLQVDDGIAGGENSRIICDPNAYPGWQRFSVTHTFSIINPSSQVRFVVNGFSILGPLYLFGAQMEVEAVASQYKHRAGYSGYHPKCFFASDEFDHQQAGFNVNSLTLNIEESN